MGLFLLLDWAAVADSAGPDGRRAAVECDAAATKKIADLHAEYPGQGVFVLRMVKRVTGEEEAVPQPGVLVAPVFRRLDPKPGEESLKRPPHGPYGKVTYKGGITPVIQKTDDQGRVYCVFPKGRYALEIDSVQTTRWPDRGREVRLDDFVCLEDAELVSDMVWVSPKIYTVVTGKEAVAWVPYPGVEKAVIRVSRIVNLTPPKAEGPKNTGNVRITVLGETPPLAPGGLTLDAVFGKAKARPGPGEDFILQITGLDKDGEPVSFNFSEHWLTMEKKDGTTETQR